MQNNYFRKDGKCFEWIYRRFVPSKDKRTKIYPKGGKKALRFPVEVDDCHCK